VERIDDAAVPHEGDAQVCGERVGHCGLYSRRKVVNGEGREDREGMDGHEERSNWVAILTVYMISAEYDLGQFMLLRHHNIVAKAATMASTLEDSIDRHAGSKSVGENK